MNEIVKQLAAEIPETAVVHVPKKRRVTVTDDEGNKRRLTREIGFEEQEVPFAGEHFSAARNRALIALDNWIREVAAVLPDELAAEFADREQDDLSTRAGITAAVDRRMAMLSEL